MAPPTARIGEVVAGSPDDELAEDGWSGSTGAPRVRLSGELRWDEQVIISLSLDLRSL
jgi:hypothetical protein